MNDLKTIPPKSERASFCEYLRRRREERDLSLDDIARTTRIPERSLAYLEQGEFEKLPADVFVRGFLRSYATCVGLDADETIRRYAACGLAPGPVAAPGAAHALVVAAPPAVPGESDEQEIDAGASEAISEARDEVDTARRAESSEQVEEEPKRPREAGRAAPSKRRRKKRRARARAAATRRSDEGVEQSARREPEAEPEPKPVSKPQSPPALVIDDEDPEAAEETLAARARGEEREKDFSRRMFLPPVLLDPDQGSRRGALTLAVIILVIVATITMSYLLRRPSSSIDGLTELSPSRGTQVAGQVELYEA